MNILIIDDDIIITSVMNALVEKYKEDHQVALECHVCNSGDEAIALVKKTYCDLIFVDVMMPGKDGLETTRELKKLYPESMVIVISSLSDELKQNEMLSLGAEDYLIKPINATLFKMRLHNYFRLITSRNHISKKSNVINSFTNTIFSYNLHFTISSEDELSEFWETLLMRHDYGSQCHTLYDAVRFFFNLGTIQLEKKINFDIYLEEDYDNYYLCMNNLDGYSDSIIERKIRSCYRDAYFNLENTVLSILLTKGSAQSEVCDLFVDLNHVDIDPEINNIEIQTYCEESENIEIYDFLDLDELEAFEEDLYGLHASIKKMGDHQFNQDDVELIVHGLHALANHINLEKDAYIIAESLENLGREIRDNSDKFISNAEDFELFCLSFVDDLILWKDMIFYKGVSSITFMDDSIMSNSNMLRSLLTEDENENTEESLDDIFAF